MEGALLATLCHALRQNTVTQAVLAEAEVDSQLALLTIVQCKDRPPRGGLH